MQRLSSNYVSYAEIPEEKIVEELQHQKEQLERDKAIAVRRVAAIRAAAMKTASSPRRILAIVPRPSGGPDIPKPSRI